VADASDLRYDTDKVARDVLAVQRLLRQTAPDLQKALNKQVRTVVKPLVDRAKANIPDVPLSRWHEDDRGRLGAARLPGFSVNTAKRGIRLSTAGREFRGEAGRRIREAKRSGKVLGASPQSDRVISAFAIVQANAGGAVYEVSGRRTRGANTFVRNLERKNGKASRGIWKAWDSFNGKDRLTAAILSAVEATMNEYNGRMSRKRR
jgi:hypothetical protein